MTKDDAAARLAPDLLPWERQPGEPEMAWQAFKNFLESDKRRVSDHGPSARNWSARYHWSHRAHEYDVYMARVDLEEQVRHRRKMNERHRRVAAVAQSKVVAWLNELDDAKVAKMNVAEATRLLDVAVRIERDATSAVGVEDLPEPYSEPARERDGSLTQRLIEAGLNVELSELADLLRKVDRPPVSVSEPPPQTDDAAPLEPQPGEETPPGSIWGDRWQPGVGPYGSPR